MIEPTPDVPVCPTSCDDDCDATCHEDHVAGHKKRHWPWDCPAADRYDWGTPFITNAVNRLRAERDEARAYAASLTGAVKSAADFTDAMQRIRETQGESAANVEAIARVVAALGAGRADAAELPQRGPELLQ